MQVQYLERRAYRGALQMRHDYGLVIAQVQYMGGYFGLIYMVGVSQPP
jgi:hypothetical protein